MWCHLILTAVHIMRQRLPHFADMQTETQSSGVILTRFRIRTQGSFHYVLTACLCFHGTVSGLLPEG